MAGGRSPGAHRTLLRLQAASAVSWAEDWMVASAVAIHAYAVGGVGAAGLAGVARMLPTAVLAPALSSIVDRWSRRRVLLVAFGVQALACGGMAGAVALGLPFASVLGLLAVEGIASVVIQPATAALLPWLARSPAQLTRANAMLAFGRAIGVVAGPLGAAALVGGGSIGWAYGAASALMATALALLAGVRVAEPRSTPVAPGAFRADLTAGLRVLRQDRAIAAVAAQLALVQGVLRGVFGVLSVVIAVELLHRDGSLSATLQAAIGLGGVMAGGVLVRWMPRRLADWFSAGIAVRTLPFLAIAAAPPYHLVIVLMVVNGMGNAAMLTGGQTLLQRLVPNELVGRTLGALWMLTTLGIAIGSAVAPVALDHAGPTPVLLVLGIGYPAVAAAAWRAVHRGERRSTAHDGDLELLGSVPFLAPLPIVTLDAVAQQVVRRPLAVGQVVTRQGEDGDTFHVIASGSVGVDVDGARVRTLGPGGWFGELALLRDSPRTATVTTLEPTETAVVGRAAFLAALAFDAGPAAVHAAVPADYVMPAADPTNAEPS